jgi:hypothetical protein
LALVTEALLAVLIPVALMAGALAMQRFEYHLLGPASHEDDDSLGVPRPGRATRSDPADGPVGAGTDGQVP